MELRHEIITENLDGEEVIVSIYADEEAEAGVTIKLDNGNEYLDDGRITLTIISVSVEIKGEEARNEYCKMLEQIEINELRSKLRP